MRVRAFVNAPSDKAQLMLELLGLLEPRESSLLREVILRPDSHDPAQRILELSSWNRSRCSDSVGRLAKSRVELANALPSWNAPSADESGWSELERVHCSEVARLIRHAADLQGGDAGDSAWPEFGRMPDLQSWRSAAALECALALVDGVESAAIEELVDLVLSSPDTWPDARALIEVSLTTEDCEAGRLALARLHLASETPRRALAVLSASLRRGVSKPNLWRLYTGLGRAHELCGGERLALEAFELASRATDLHPTPYVDGFFLALVVGEAELAEGLAQRMEAAKFPSGRMRRVRAALKTRLARRAVSLPWSPSDQKTQRLFRQLSSCDSGAASRLCRELSDCQPESN